MLEIPCREHNVSRGSLDNILQLYICWGEMKIIFKHLHLKPQSLILNLENLGNLSVYLREPFILVYFKTNDPRYYFCWNTQQTTRFLCKRDSNILRIILLAFRPGITENETKQTVLFCIYKDCWLSRHARRYPLTLMIIEKKRGHKVVFSILLKT